MQTKEDIKKWEKYLVVVAEISKRGDHCDWLPCSNCPFGFQTNGYGVGVLLSCIELGLRDHFTRQVLSDVCTKYLSGDITFVDGKLVEVED